MIGTAIRQERNMSKQKISLDDLKNFLEKKISQVKEELEILEFLLSLVESGVISRGLESSMKEGPRPGEEVIPIRTSEGIHIADMYVSDSDVRVVPRVQLNINVPPFRKFLIEKVLEKMKAKDLELVHKGLLSPDLILEYSFEAEGELLKEITIKNVRDDKRKTEIKSTVRWTFEKMYEKMKSGRQT